MTTASGSKIGTITIENGSITDSGTELSFGSNNLITSGSLSVSGNTKFSDVEFDSLKALELIAFNDENFEGIKISSNKIDKCKTFGDLIKLYENKIN